MGLPTMQLTTVTSQLSPMTDSSSTPRPLMLLPPLQITMSTTPPPPTLTPPTPPPPTTLTSAPTTPVTPTAPPTHTRSPSLKPLTLPLMPRPAPLSTKSLSLTLFLLCNSHLLLNY